MKKTKKLLSFFIILSMICQLMVFSMPLAMADGESDIFETLRAETNLYGDNAGFEDGTNDGWSKVNPYAYGTIDMEVTDAQSCSGDYSAALYGKTQPHLSYTKKLNYDDGNVREGATYITSAKVLGTEQNLVARESDMNKDNAYANKFKWTNPVKNSIFAYVKGTEVLPADLATAPVFGTEGQEKLGSDAWTDFTAAFTTIDTIEAGTIFELPYIAWMLKGVEYYIDDLYFGELMVADVKANCPEEITIPLTGERSVNLTAVAYNQLGTTDFLEDSTFSWELTTDAEGVSVDGSNLIISASAEEQAIDLTVTCEPTFLGNDTQSEEIMAYRSKNVTINLTTPDDIQEYIRESTNIFGANSGFEHGNTAGWIFTGSGSMSMQPSSVQAYSGEYSALLSEKTSHNIGYVYKINTGNAAINPSSTYIMSVKALGTEANVATAEENDPGYGNPTYEATFRFRIPDGSGGLFTIKENTTVKAADFSQAPAVSEQEQDKLDQSEWTEFSALVTTADTVAENTDYLLPYLTYTYKDVEFYMDDMYFGELMVARVEDTIESKDINIPKKGEEAKKIKLSAKAYNQLGTTQYLDNTAFTWTLANPELGVEITEENGEFYLVVDDTAMGQELVLTATANPTFAGAEAQSEDIKTFRSLDVSFNLIPDSSLPDEATVINQLLSGSVVEGGTLNLSFDYWQKNKLPQGATEINWYRATSVDGPWEKFTQGVTSYTIPTGGDIYLYKVGIVPKVDGEPSLTGEEVFTNHAAEPTAPVASNVKISGEQFAGAEWEFSYDFFDVNLDTALAPIVVWQIADSVDGPYTDIQNPPETSATYKVRESDAGKYIRVALKPVSDAAPATGDETPSEGRLACTVPSVKGLTIVPLSGNILGFNADYYTHPLNIPEGSSVYEWYIGNSLVKTGSQFDASKYNGVTVTLKVTPMAEKPPYAGTPATASYTISRKTVNAGGSGISSGGGGGGGSFVPSVPVVTPQTIANIPDWAKESVDFVMSKGYMTVASQGDFGGNNVIGRGEFLQIILKACGIEPSAYSGEFGDVTADASYSGLLQSAVDKGIISKADNFYPDRSLRRDEMCKIITASLSSATGKELPTADTSRFADKDSFSGWALDYVNKAVGAGLVIGVSDTQFMPEGTVTRAQAAVIAKRLADFIINNK